MEPCCGNFRAPAALHVYVSYPAALPDLREFLQRAECVVGECNAYDLEVDLPHAVTPRQERRELDVYLATWQTLHPGIEAYVIETDAASSPGQ